MNMKQVMDTIPSCPTPMKYERGRMDKPASRESLLRLACNGCRCALPVKDGVHYQPMTGSPVMGCLVLNDK